MITLLVMAGYLLAAIVIVAASLGIFYAMTFKEETATASFQLDPEGFKKDFRLLGIASISMVTAFVMVAASYVLEMQILIEASELVGGIHVAISSYVFFKWARRFM
ncbi:MAG: hypothetical protein ACI83Q_000117 [Colwellia polaris]|jgi:hypothetical protein